MYVGDILEGTAQKAGSPVILKEKLGTALVDAQNVLGPVSILPFVTCCMCNQSSQFS